MEISDAKVIVCAGSGGVGKTTISASLGCWLAMEGKKTLVLTIDPAKRLAQALGIDGQLEQDVQINDPRLNGNLFATMLDPQTVFDRFIRKAAPQSEVAEKLLNNRLYKQLATSLSGSQEFTALERVLSAVSNYDVLILDTPPSQNAVDFLKAPERLFSLFQESVTKWFSGRESERGFLATLFSRGTRTVITALERVTGSQFIKELTDFFQQMSQIQSRVAERSMDVHRLLLSPSTRFILVTGFDEEKIREAVEFQEDLTAKGYSLTGVIMNRCFPDWTTVNADSWEPSLAVLKEYYLLMRKQFENRLKQADDLQKKIPGIKLCRVPEMKNSPQAIDDLINLANYLKEKSENP